MVNIAPLSTSEIKWYLPADYPKIHPKRNRMVTLAVTRLTDDTSSIAEGPMWTDGKGKPQWSIRSINGTPFSVFESAYGLKQTDYRLDYWADTIKHPHHENKK